MKRIKFKQNKKTAEIAEVCKIASDCLYVYISPYDLSGEIEVTDDDTSIADAINTIRENLSTGNQYKEASDNSIKKIIKDNYILVDLFHKCDCLESSNDHSWDNAIFNGAL